MKINLKNSKGITIITLIITIIVMIILATISIKYGLRSINSVQDSTIETGLETVQQALIQQYTKANSINGENNEITDFSKKSDKYYGTPQSEEDIKKILEKHGVKGSENKFNLLNFDYTNNKYTSTVTDDNAYYLLEPSDLEKLGITGAKGSSYLVNYSTGEVWDLGNVTYEDGEYAYINGIGTELEIAKEDFVDSPIKISLVGDVKSENGKYTITLRVTDELAKISSDPNDKDKHITNKDIIDNIITLKVDDTKVDKSKITVKDPIVKPDNKQSIKEYYEYVIEVDESVGGGKDFPELDIIINEGAIEDVKDYSNPKTELSAIINDSTKNQKDISFALGTPVYETKNEEFPNGFTDEKGITWGNSANVELKLKCENGLKSQDYVFNYTFGSGENKKITLRAREGEKEVSGTIHLDSYTGKNLELKVWPANSSDTGRNSNTIGIDSRTARVNLDNEPISINLYVSENGEKKALKEYIDNGGYFRVNTDQQHRSRTIPAIGLIEEDKESGLNVEISAHNATLFTYYALTYMEDERPNANDTSTQFGYWYPVVSPVENRNKFERSDHGSFNWDLNNKSGEYKFWLTNVSPYKFALYNYPMTDRIGNLSENSEIYTLKIDNFAPKISGINIDGNIDAKIMIEDDYSGLSKDYSKIKYAWVKSKSEIPTKWNSVTEENIKPVSFNENDNALKLQAIVECPKEKGEWYLCTTIDEYEDVAGNKSNDGMVYSEESVTTIKYDIELNYVTKSETNSNGYVDPDGTTWGTSANVNVTLECKNGLKEQKYVFDYVYKDEKNQPIKNGSITLKPNEDDKTVTGTITLDSYSGKGVLTVTPNDEHYSGKSSYELGNDSKSVNVNLDNEIPELKVYYDDEEKELEYYSSENVFFRTIYNKDGYGMGSLSPKISFKFIDKLSGIEITNKFDDGTGYYTQYYAFSRGEDKVPNGESNQNTDVWYGWTGANYIRPGYTGTTEVKPKGVFRCTYKKEKVYEDSLDRSNGNFEDKYLTSGEYYLWLTHVPCNAIRDYKLVDNVGNSRKEDSRIGPLKIDTFSPVIDSVEVTDNGKIIISDDYSGLSEDYSKIKYAWVKNKNETPSEWLDVKKENVEVIEYNEFNNAEKIEVTIKRENKYNGYYLCTKIEGFEDIAGNPAGSDCMYSEITIVPIEYDIELNYQTKDTDNPNGFTDSEGITWGTSANVNVILKCENGLKAQDYIFNYVYKDENNKTIKNGKITLKPNEDDKAATGTITLDSYSGKGVLTVTPNDEHYSGTNSYELGNDSKSVNVNLDNEIPELKVWYDDGSGEKELTEDYYSKNDVFFRFAHSDKENTNLLDNLTPDITFLFEDKFSDVKLYEGIKWNSWAISKVEDDKLPPQDSIIRWSLWNGERFYKEEDGYGKSFITLFGYFRPTEKREELLKPGYDENPNLEESEKKKNRYLLSGKYYFWFSHIAPNSNNKTPLCDNVGNAKPNFSKIGPLKFDTFSPRIDSINVDDGKIIISDDYSGLSNDYTKIKYAWVANKNETPNESDWKTITSKNVRILGTNEFENLEKIEITVEQPEQTGELYLCAKIEGYTDIAGNAAGNTIEYSKETMKIESDLEIIDIFEQDELSYPTNVTVLMESKSKKKFGIKEFWYEHEGLNDHIGNPFSETQYHPDGKAEFNIQSTVNGPIIIHIIDSLGKEYTKEFKMEKVQETILEYEISNVNDKLMLPICLKPEQEKNILIYVDWGDGNSQFFDKPSYEFIRDTANTNQYCVKLYDDFIHTYNSSKRFKIKISGNIERVWNYAADMTKAYKAIDDLNKENMQNLFSYSQSHIKVIHQFGIHGAYSGNLPMTFIMDSWYSNCNELRTILNNDNNKYAFMNVSSLWSTFENTPITTFNWNDFSLAKNITYFRYTFANTNIEKISNNAFWACESAENFSGTFANNSQLSIIPPEGELFKDLINVTDFSDTFKNTSITSIPSNLFSSNINASDFSRTFYKTNIKSIPIELFASNKNAERFISTFENCAELTYADCIFKNCPNAKTFSKCFKDTPNLRSVNPNIFDINSGEFNMIGTAGLYSFETGFESVFYNSGLVWDSEEKAIEYKDLFKYSNKVPSFSAAFSSCKNIKFVDKELFLHNDKVESFANVFEGTSISSIDSKIFNSSKKTLKSLSSAFSHCENLNIADNEYWFKDYTMLNDFSGIFSNCTNLNEIPKGIFSTIGTQHNSSLNFTTAFSDTGIENVKSDIWGVRK